MGVGVVGYFFFMTAELRVNLIGQMVRKNCSIIQHFHLLGYDPELKGIMTLLMMYLVTRLNK